MPNRIIKIKEWLYSKVGVFNAQRGACPDKDNYNETIGRDFTQRLAVKPLAKPLREAKIRSLAFATRGECYRMRPLSHACGYRR